MTQSLTRSRLTFVLLMTAVLLMGTLAVQVSLAPAPVEATHLRSTQLTWAETATENEAQFTATIATRGTYFGSPGVGGTFSEPSVNFGDGSSSVSPLFTVTFADTTNDFIIATASFSHAYAAAGPYTVVLNICCRLSLPQHINNPDGNNRAETIVNFDATSASPVSSISPIIDCPLDAVCTFFVPATDADGQPLRFRFASAAEADGSSFDQPGPPDATNAATIDPVTGVFQWNTTGATLNPGTNASLPDTFYSVQVMVENVVGQAAVTKTPVDFFIRLRSGSTNQAPTFIAPTPADGSVLDAAVGVLFSCATAASDADTGDTVTMAMLGKPTDATYTTVAGNPATGLFEWTPAATGSVILTLIATDQNGAGAVPRSVTINVSATAVASPALCPSAIVPTASPSPSPREDELGSTPTPAPIPDTAFDPASAAPTGILALLLLSSMIGMSAARRAGRRQ